MDVIDEQAHHFRDDPLWSSTSGLSDAMKRRWQRLMESKHYGYDPDRFGGLPVVTPETWSRYKRNCVCGACDYCLHLRDIRDWPSDRLDPVRMRLPEERPLFSSVEAALHRWCARGGHYATRSSAQTVDSFLQQGTMIQSSSRPSGGIEHRQAEENAALSKRLRGVFPRCTTYALSFDDWVRLVLLAIVGRSEIVRGRNGAMDSRRDVRVPTRELGLEFSRTQEQVSEIVESAMNELRIELAARGEIDADRVAYRVYQGKRLRGRIEGRKKELGVGGD